MVYLFDCFSNPFPGGWIEMPLFYKIEKDKHYWKINSKHTRVAYIKFKFQCSLSNLT